jgi:hypothetical protein
MLELLITFASSANTASKPLSPVKAAPATYFQNQLFVLSVPFPKVSVL